MRALRAACRQDEDRQCSCDHAPSNARRSQSATSSPAERSCHRWRRGLEPAYPASPARRPKTTPIRPFRVNVPEEALVDLRRRIAATQWPERETVADQSQGVQLATMQELARYWATDYDWRKVRGETERLAAVHHRDRWAGHSFHPRSFETCECVAAHRHARMARLDHRAAEDHRSTDQSHGTWRERIGRVPCRDSVDAGLRVFRQADHAPAGAPSAWAEPGQN